ncbi:MAG: hypothetical protein AAGA68_16865 [Pseudomonadota bacterium]
MDDPSQAAANNWSVWAGFEHHRPKLRLAGRYGYGETNFSATANDRFSSSGERWLLSTDYKLFDSVWIGMSYGEATGSIDALDGERFMLTVRLSEPKRMNIFAQE